MPSCSRNDPKLTTPGEPPSPAGATVGRKDQASRSRTDFWSPTTSTPSTSSSAIHTAARICSTPSSCLPHLVTDERRTTAPRSPNLPIAVSPPGMPTGGPPSWMTSMKDRVEAFAPFHLSDVAPLHPNGPTPHSGCRRSLRPVPPGATSIQPNPRRTLPLSLHRPFLGTALTGGATSSRSSWKRLAITATSNRGRLDWV